MRTMQDIGCVAVRSQPAAVHCRCLLGLIAVLVGVGSALAGAQAPFCAVPANHINLPTIVLADNMKVVVQTITGTYVTTDLVWAGGITNLNAQGLYDITRGADSAYYNPLHYEVAIWSAAKYLSDGICKMTGQRLPTASHHQYPLNNVIMLTTLAALTNSPNAPSDVVSNAVAALSVGNVYDQAEAFYIHTETGGVYIVANTWGGLDDAVVELLAGDNALAGGEIGYETLGMGPNWTYAPDFTTSSLTFNMEYSGRPGYYSRQLVPERAQYDGIGTLSQIQLVADGFADGLAAPDQTVEVSDNQWQMGARVYAKSFPDAGKQILQTFNSPVARHILATRVTQGFVQPTQLGLNADRPTAATGNAGMIWINTDNSGPQQYQAYVSSGTAWAQYDLNSSGGLNTDGTAFIDVSVPFVRGMVLTNMVTEAEKFWQANPGQMYSFSAEPADGGVVDTDFVRYTANPNWYADYRAANGQSWGTYALNGTSVGPVPSQTTESWWSVHTAGGWSSSLGTQDVANVQSDTVHAFNNWLLSEFDKYVAGLPATNRVSGGLSKTNLVLVSCLSYGRHDVPPNFNDDPRVCVSVADYPEHRGLGKWMGCATKADVMKAFSYLTPQPSIVYWILAQSIPSDWGLENIAADAFSSASDIHAAVQGPYNAGCRAILAQMDYNFGKLGLDYYLYSKMFWNPSLTVAQLDALRTRWITRAYGTDALPFMLDYYSLMQPKNFFNAPNFYAQALHCIQQADSVTVAGTPEKARLDDLKQFWYCYYLQDTGLTTTTQAGTNVTISLLPAVQEFIWKSEMSYMNAAYMFQWQLVGPYTNVVHGRGGAGFCAGTNTFLVGSAGGTNTYFSTGTNLFYSSGSGYIAPPHYTATETSGWWAKMLAHWPYTPVSFWADAVLTNGQAAAAVDLNNLVGVEEFHSANQTATGYPYYPNHYVMPVPLITADCAGDVIGCAISRESSDLALLTYGIDRWNSEQQQWENVVNRAVYGVLTNNGTASLTTVQYSAPSAGTYRIALGTLPGSSATLTTLGYDSVNRTNASVAIPHGLTFNQLNTMTYIWFPDTYVYIPKGTRSLDVEPGSTVRSVQLYTGLPSTGLTPTRVVSIPRDVTCRITLNPGEDGSIAKFMGGLHQLQPYLYSIPNLWALAPELLLVPHDIAVADGLTPYPSTVADTEWATGGTVTNYTLNGTNFTAHSFTESGTFTVNSNVYCEVLVVAGGGGGGGDCAGGGGAGGAVVRSFLLPPGTYPVTVGAGGTAGPVDLPSGQGGNSVFGAFPLAVTAFGGGGGSSYLVPALSGASGGGGEAFTASSVTNGAAGIAGQGHAGGNGKGGFPYTGGGGGGAGSVGGNGTSTQGGKGGDGLTFDFASGVPANYAGGGGGCFAYTGGGGTAGNGGSGGGGSGGLGAEAGSNGAANSGSGGGGGGWIKAGGTGGSGIVIVRYVGGLIPSLMMSGGPVKTYTVNGTNYNSLFFTSSGTLTVNSDVCCQVLVVGGGGGGGGGEGGGGGGGGVITQTLNLATGTYAVTVGEGGAGGMEAGGWGNSGSVGSNSSLSSLIVATGGGGGAGDKSGQLAASGGSGGGGNGWQAANYAGAAGIAGQGHAGGNGNNGGSLWWDGGGGGGAGGPGSNGFYNASVNGCASGGRGMVSAISGEPADYGGGGGGGSSWPGDSGGAGGYGGGGKGGGSGASAQAGQDNTGGGGGGGAPSGVGGMGGSGIVILRYVSRVTPSQMMSGGLIKTYVANGTNFAAHIFTNSGTLTVYGDVRCRALVVGGGGGGGGGEGGGGGGGGVITQTLTLAAGTYAVTVGEGGAGGIEAGSWGDSGSVGSNSSLSSLIVATGGGGGAGDKSGQLATSGGSGGGGNGWQPANYTGAVGIAGQGHAGGNGNNGGNPWWDGGGGGGAASPGSNGFFDANANGCAPGGSGITSDISGEPVGYGGGGGGSSSWPGDSGGAGGYGGGGKGGGSGASAQAGQDNTGGGGGGGAPVGVGGRGGSGVVIVCYGTEMLSQLRATAIHRTESFSQSGTIMICR